MTLSIRLATTADLPALSALHIASCVDIYTPLVPREVAEGLPGALRALWAEETLGGGDFMLMAEDEAGAVGLATVRAGEPAYVDHFHIRPDAKGRGIGRRLWAALLEELRARGAAAVKLDFLDGNEGARGFYLSMGGEIGAEEVGDLFGTPVRAWPVRWRLDRP